MLVYILGLKLAYSVYKQRSFHQMGRFFFDELLNKWVLLVLLTMFVYGIMGLIDQPLSKIWSINYGQDCPTVMWQMWFLFRNLQMDCKVCLPWFWLLQSELLLTIFAAPFIIIFRIHKILGYGLLMLIIFASTIVGYAILDNQGVIFEPYKLFNMQS